MKLCMCVTLWDIWHVFLTRLPVTPYVCCVCFLWLVVQYVVCVIVSVGRDSQHVGRLSTAAGSVSCLLLGSRHPRQCQVMPHSVSLLIGRTCAFSRLWKEHKAAPKTVVSLISSSGHCVVPDKCFLVLCTPPLIGLDQDAWKMGIFVERWRSSCLMVFVTPTWRERRPKLGPSFRSQFNE